MISVHSFAKIIAIGTIGAGVLNFILNAVMIPVWGMHGAAIAASLSYLALFFAHCFIATHVKGHPFHMKMTAFIPGEIGMIVACSQSAAVWPLGPGHGVGMLRVIMVPGTETTNFKRLYHNIRLIFAYHLPDV